MREAKLAKLIDRAVHAAVTQANLEAEGRAQLLRDDHADHVAQINAAHLAVHNELLAGQRNTQALITENAMILSQQVSGLGEALVGVEARIRKTAPVKAAPVKRPARKRAPAKKK